MNARGLLGRSGEDMVARIYRKAGYAIVARNVRLPGGEVDLIVRRGSLLVFCEVKTRTTDRFGQPSEAVNPRKRARVRRLAGRWLRANPMPGVKVRFDVVSVIVAGRKATVTHIPNAF
jgi:putative endonuclease